MKVYTFFLLAVFTAVSSSEVMKVPPPLLDINGQNNTVTDYGGFKPLYADKDPRFVSLTTTMKPSSPNFMDKVKSMLFRKNNNFATPGSNYKYRYYPYKNYPVPGMTGNIGQQSHWGQHQSYTGGFQQPSSIPSQGYTGTVPQTSASHQSSSGSNPVSSYIPAPSSMTSGIKRYFNSVMQMIRRSFMQRRNSHYVPPYGVIQATPGATMTPAAPQQHKKKKVIKRIKKKREKRNAAIGGSSGYRMPGIFFGNNNGSSFYMQKDPSTGQLTYPSENSESKAAKPIIIHSYSSTKQQGQINATELFKKSESLKKKRVKLVRPTFHKKKNDTGNTVTTLAPPRLPSFYQFVVTTTTTKRPSPVLIKNATKVVTQVHSRPSPVYKYGHVKLPKLPLINFDTKVIEIDSNEIAEKTTTTTTTTTTEQPKSSMTIISSTSVEQTEPKTPVFRPVFLPSSVHVVPHSGVPKPPIASTTKSPQKTTKSPPTTPTTPNPNVSINTPQTSGILLSDNHNMMGATGGQGDIDPQGQWEFDPVSGLITPVKSQFQPVKGQIGSNGHINPFSGGFSSNGLLDETLPTVSQVDEMVDSNGQNLVSDSFEQSVPTTSKVSSGETNAHSSGHHVTSAESSSQHLVANVSIQQIEPNFEEAEQVVPSSVSVEVHEPSTESKIHNADKMVPSEEQFGQVEQDVHMGAESIETSVPATQKVIVEQENSEEEETWILEEIAEDEPLPVVTPSGVLHPPTDAPAPKQNTQNIVPDSPSLSPHPSPTLNVDLGPETPTAPNAHNLVPGQPLAPNGQNMMLSQFGLNGQNMAHGQPMAPNGQLVPPQRPRPYPYPMPYPHGGQHNSFGDYSMMKMPPPPPHNGMRPPPMNGQYPGGRPYPPFFYGNKPNNMQRPGPMWGYPTNNFAPNVNSSFTGVAGQMPPQQIPQQAAHSMEQSVQMSVQSVTSSVSSGEQEPPLIDIFPPSVEEVTVETTTTTTTPEPTTTTTKATTTTTTQKPTTTTTKTTTTVTTTTTTPTPTTTTTTTPKPTTTTQKQITTTKTPTHTTTMTSIKGFTPRPHAPPVPSEDGEVKETVPELNHWWGGLKAFIDQQVTDYYDYEYETPSVNSINPKPVGLNSFYSKEVGQSAEPPAPSKPSTSTKPSAPPAPSTTTKRVTTTTTQRPTTTTIATTTTIKPKSTTTVTTTSAPKTTAAPVTTTAPAISSTTEESIEYVIEYIDEDEDVTPAQSVVTQQNGVNTISVPHSSNTPIGMRPPPPPPSMRHPVDNLKTNSFLNKLFGRFKSRPGHYNSAQPIKYNNQGQFALPDSDKHQWGSNNNQGAPPQFIPHSIPQPFAQAVQPQLKPNLAPQNNPTVNIAGPNGAQAPSMGQPLGPNQLNHPVQSLGPHPSNRPRQPLGPNQINYKRPPLGQPLGPNQLNHPDQPLGQPLGTSQINHPNTGPLVNNNGQPVMVLPGGHNVYNTPFNGPSHHTMVPQNPSMHGMTLPQQHFVPPPPPKHAWSQQPQFTSSNPPLTNNSKSSAPASGEKPLSSSEEVIYVTPEEFEKLKASGHADEFEFYDDDEFYYSDEDNSIQEIGKRNGTPAVTLAPDLAQGTTTILTTTTTSTTTTSKPKHSHYSKPSTGLGSATWGAPPASFSGGFVQITPPAMPKPLNAVQNDMTEQKRPHKVYKPEVFRVPQVDDVSVPISQWIAPQSNTNHVRTILKFEQGATGMSYDDSVELITAGPPTQPSNKPRDVIVKSSFIAGHDNPNPWRAGSVL